MWLVSAGSRPRLTQIAPFGLVGAGGVPCSCLIEAAACCALTLSTLGACRALALSRLGPLACLGLSPLVEDLAIDVRQPGTGGICVSRGRKPADRCPFEI